MLMIQVHGADYSVPGIWEPPGSRPTRDYSSGGLLGWRSIRETLLSFSMGPMLACCARKTVDATGSPKEPRRYRELYSRLLSMVTAVVRWPRAELAFFSPRMAWTGRMYWLPVARRPRALSCRVQTLQLVFISQVPKVFS